MAEVLAAVKGYRDRMEAEHNGRMSLAWHTEALRRRKQMPSLSRLISRGLKRPKPVDPAEGMAAIREAEAAIAADIARNLADGQAATHD